MSELDLDEDYIPTPAEAAHKRALDLVVKDHALEAWGTLRGIDQLDSAKAQQILIVVMQKLLLHAKKTKVESKSEQNNQLFQAGKKLRSVVVELWGQTGSN